MLELWGMQSTFPLLSLPVPLWPRELTSDRVLSMDQIELNYILMLNLIAWNRPVLTFKLQTYAKLNCLKWNCFCMLNWIVWNRTVFDIETVLTVMGTLPILPWWTLLTIISTERFRYQRQINIGVIWTVRDFLPFLCDSIFLV